MTHKKHQAEHNTKADTLQYMKVSCCKQIARQH